MSDFSVNITGAHGLIDRMSSLPDKLQRKGAKAAARKAMNLVRNAARATARGIDDPETREQIWKNIVTQDSPKGGRRVGGVVMRVGVRGGASYSRSKAAAAASNPGGYTWYWRFLELGAETVTQQEFLLPAMTGQAQRVADTVSTELWQQIEKLTPKT